MGVKSPFEIAFIPLFSRVHTTRFRKSRCCPQNRNSSLGPFSVQEQHDCSTNRNGFRAMSKSIFRGFPPFAGKVWNLISAQSEKYLYFIKNSTVCSGCEVWVHSESEITSANITQQNSRCVLRTCSLLRVSSPRSLTVDTNMKAMLKRFAELFHRISLNIHGK